MNNSSQLNNERPLVTFALFAYNQEQYIREAIEGAFSQTYEPLEIILSDDYSSDRTFKIMQEMAAAYQGPHTIVVRRSSLNCGIIDHVLSVAKIASGELMCVAAGDDISLPNRTSAIVKSWHRNPKAVAFYSGCMDIDHNGSVLVLENFPEPSLRTQRLFLGCKAAIRYSGLVRNIPGYSASYKTNLLQNLPFTGKKAHNEDALTTLIINLFGHEIEFINEILMKRRLSLTSISVRPDAKSYKSILLNEILGKNFAKSSVNFLEYLESLDFLKKSNDYEIVMSRLLDNKELFIVQSQFWDLSFLERWQRFFKVKKTNTKKYIFPRLWGKYIFYIVKFLQTNYINRTM